MEISSQLLDSISNCIVADAIYDTEDETTVEKFLRESTKRNKNKNCNHNGFKIKNMPRLSKIRF